MRALVTGAGGFLGSWLVRRLRAEGHAVRAMVRPGAAEPGLGAEAPGVAAAGASSSGAASVDVVRGDVTNPDSLPAAVAGCDVVFHLAGLRRATRRQEFLRVNAEGTRTLLEACLTHAPGLSRFVLAGSLAAAGPSATGRREEEPLAPVEWYGESKAEAERITLGYAARLPVTVARPPRITGPGDRDNLFFFRIVARGVIVGVTGAPRPLSFVDVEDCARGFLLLAQRPEAVGQAFFLAHRERTTLEGLQEEVAHALGVRTRTVRVPPWLLRGAGSAADVASRALGRRLPFNRKLSEQVLAPGWTCDTEKASRRLGFQARTSLAESIERSARSYREQGWL